MRAAKTNVILGRSLGAACDFSGSHGVHSGIQLRSLNYAGRVSQHTLNICVTVIEKMTQTVLRVSPKIRKIRFVPAGARHIRREAAQRTELLAEHSGAGEQSSRKAMIALQNGERLLFGDANQEHGTAIRPGAQELAERLDSGDEVAGAAGESHHPDAVHDIA
jgi:hypothetical protein